MDCNSLKAIHIETLRYTTVQEVNAFKDHFPHKDCTLETAHAGSSMSETRAIRLHTLEVAEVEAKKLSIPRCTFFIGFSLSPRRSSGDHDDRKGATAVTRCPSRRSIATGLGWTSLEGVLDKATSISAIVTFTMSPMWRRDVWKGWSIRC